MHNTMLVSHMAHGAWHAWVLCRALMADLRAARLVPKSAAAPSQEGSPADTGTENHERADLTESA